MMKKIFLIIGMLVVCSLAEIMTDARDGQTYKTVKIGNQVWIAENLNYKTSGSVCYDNNLANCKKYGALYTWDAANKACPSGWHLPNYDEWDTLVVNALGSYISSDKKLKSKSGWKAGENGSDSFGFAVLPAGLRNFKINATGFLARESAGYFNSEDDVYFEDEGESAHFWSSTEANNDDAHHWGFHYLNGSAFHNAMDKNKGFSVRCVQD